MSGIPSAFTRDTLGLMGAQAQFFDSVVKVSRQTGVGLQITSPGSHSVLKRMSNGDWSLRMSYVLDDNYRDDDGRLSLTDTFVLTSNFAELNQYSRKVDYVGPQKMAALWQGRKKAFAQANLPEGEQWKQFFQQVGQSLIRPVFTNDRIWQRIATEKILLNYFTQLGEAAWAKVPGISLKILDPESNYQVIDHGAERELVFHWVLDRDNGPESGRYFLTERVKFHQASQEVTQIHRSISAPNEVWAHLKNPGLNSNENNEYSRLRSMSFPDHASSLAAYQKLIDVLKLENHDWKDRSTTQELKQLVDLGTAVGQMNDQGRAYWLDLVGGAQRIYPRWTLRTQDPESWVKLRPLGPYQEVLLQTVMSDFENPDAKKVLVNDRFTATKNFDRVVSWSRNVLPSPQVGNNPISDAEWQALKNLPNPTSEQINDFMKKMGPALAPFQEKVFEKVLADQADQVSLPVDLSIDMEIDPDPGDEILSKLSRDIFFTVLLERVGQQTSAGRAWLAKEYPVTAHQVTELMKYLEGTQERDIFVGLRKLSLSTEFKTLRKEILKDPLFRELRDILNEADEEIRHRELLTLARNQLFQKYHLYGSAHALAKFLGEDPNVGAEANELQKFLEGKGNLGTKFELMGSTFMDHLFDRNTLLAMMAAGIGGAWVETQALRALGSYGKIGTGIAKVGGTLSEAAAFTVTQQIGQSFDQDPAEVWKHTGSHLLSASLLFGFLRLGHFGSSHLTKVLGFPAEAGWRRGIWGDLLQGSFQGVAGVEGMYLGGLASRILGLDAPNDQGLGHHQFDALVSYLQATLGFRLAHGMAPGYFKQTLQNVQYQRYRAQRAATVKTPGKPSEPAWVERGRVETDPQSDPTPLPPPVPLGDSNEVSPVIRRLPLPPPPDFAPARPRSSPPPIPPARPRASTVQVPAPLPPPEGQTSPEVVLLTKPKPSKTPPLPPPPTPAKPALGEAKGKVSDGVPKPIWWDEPTEPHGKVQVSETVLQETLPHMMRDLITRWAVKRIEGMNESSTPKIENLAFNLGALLEKSRAFPESTARALYGRYRFRIPVQIDPVHRQLTVPPEPRQALQNKGAQQKDPVLKVIYDILVGLDGLQLGSSGKNKTGNTRDRFPTSQPLEPNYPANSEVVDANREALRNRYHETAPRQLDMTKETAIRRSRYQVGVISMDSEGRIDVKGLSRPNFDVPNFGLFQTSTKSDPVSFMVIVAKDHVVWHGSLPEKMNESQRAALNALTESAPEWYESDPYGVDALLQQGMGPLALDLGEVMGQHSRKINEMDPIQELLVYRENGMLRAKDARHSQAQDATQLAARVQLEWRIEPNSKIVLQDVKYLWQENNFSVAELSKLLKFIQNRIQDNNLSNGKLPAKTPPIAETPEVKLTPFQLLMGEKSSDGPRELFQKYPGAGEFYGLTEEGIGYKSYNEDGMAVINGPKGEKIFLLMDGAGGHAPAKDAVELTLRKISQHVQQGVPFSEAILTAHESFLSSFSESRSTFLASRIFNEKAQFFWVGDSKALLLRKDSDGNWQWVYQTPEDSQARRLVDHEIQNMADPQKKQEMLSRRTQEIILHPFSHILSNAFGEKSMRLNETEHGTQINSTGEISKTISLENGDVLLMVSDGFLDNQIQTRRYLDLIKHTEAPELIGAMLYRETHYVMKKLAEAKVAKKEGLLPSGTRFSFVYEGEAPDLKGKTLFLELQQKGTGLLYDAPQGGNLLGHFKADNLSIGVYRHGEADSDTF